MPKTYLNLVEDFCRDAHINGGLAPSSVAGQDGDYAKAAYWVAEADLQIQKEYIDWNFLWQFATEDLTEGSSTIPEPSDTPERFVTDRKTMRVLDSNGQSYPVTFMDWSEFQDTYRYETQNEQDVPSFWSESPAGVMYLSSPVANSGYSVKYAYWRQPVRMETDEDESLIPDLHRRIIVVRAKIMYAEHENAPEVADGATGEYAYLIGELKDRYAPGKKHNRMSESDVPLTVVNE